jgi:glycosyltransferase involved in cell wall biosynthesis
MKQKLLRITTIPHSLASLLKGQLQFLNQYYDVTAIADSEDTQTWKVIAEREQVKCYPIPMKRDISIFNDIKSLFKLYSYFKKERPFIVHTNTPKASLLGMVAAKFAKIPNRIYTVTGLRFEGTAGFKRNVLIFMERVTCWAATKIIPEGEGVKQTLLKNKITSKELKVIANGNINGIDTTYFSISQITDNTKSELKNNLKINSNDIVFCFVGRLVKDKGINELVQSFKEINKEFSNTKLLLVGNFEKELDPILPQTEQEIETNPNIISVGFQKDVRPYLTISDIFVFPSYREGFPNVVMQAGAMELPSIVTDINGCNEIIENGVNGLIIPSKNKKILQEKMLLLLENLELRNKLKSNAREMIASCYEQKMVWEALLEEYKNLEKNV